jgi:hypothetical protein
MLRFTLLKCLLTSCILCAAAKKNGQYGGGGGFSLFDLDNLPDFEPLQAALSLLQGKPAPTAQQFGGYGNEIQQNEPEQNNSEQEQLTPQRRTEYIMSGLDKLLSVSKDCTHFTFYL